MLQSKKIWRIWSSLDLASILMLFSYSQEEGQGHWYDVYAKSIFAYLAIPRERGTLVSWRYSQLVASTKSSIWLCSICCETWFQICENRAVVLAQGHTLRQKEERIFIGCLQCVKHSAKHDTCSILFDPHNNTMRWGLFACPFCREESRSVGDVYISKSQQAQWQEYSYLVWTAESMILRSHWNFSNYKNTPNMYHIEINYGLQLFSPPKIWAT